MFDYLHKWRIYFSLQYKVKNSTHITNVKKNLKSQFSRYIILNGCIYTYIFMQTNWKLRKKYLIIVQ